MEIVDQHCKGLVEVRNSDGTRTDCIEGGYAWEYDYASKWYNGTTQALHYAGLTGLRPGLRLIIRNQSDFKFVDRFKTVRFDWRLPIEMELVYIKGWNE